MTQKLGQCLVQLCYRTCLDQILKQPWTRYCLSFLDTCLSLLVVLIFAEATIFIVCSAKTTHFLKPTPQNRNTTCEHNCPNRKKLFFLLHFFGGGPFPCFFWGGTSFFLVKQKGLNSKNTYKKEPDNKIQTSKQSNLERCKRKSNTHTHKTFQLHFKKEQTTQQKEQQKQNWKSKHLNQHCINKKH